METTVTIKQGKHSELVRLDPNATYFVIENIHPKIDTIHAYYIDESGEYERTWDGPVPTNNDCTFLQKKQGYDFVAIKFGCVCSEDVSFIFRQFV